MGEIQSSARILSVAMACSQGAGMNNHSADHPAGRSQVRHRALVPHPRGTDRGPARERDLPLLHCQPKANTTPCRLSPAVPEARPFPPITCASQHQILDPAQTQSIERFCSILLVNPVDIPALLSGETLRG